MTVRILIMALTAAMLAQPVFAQTAATGPQGRNWAEIAQLPDWSGAWQIEPRTDPQHTAVPVPFSPAYDSILQRLRAISAKGGDAPGNAKLCIPMGPLILTPLMLSEFLFTPGQVTMISEKRDVRRIYTDGRGHPANVPQTFYGDTTGHWEGDTLVTETVGLRGDDEIFYAMKLGEAGKDIKLAERFHVDKPDHFTIDIVMHSPTAFTAPYPTSISYKRVPFPVLDNVCAQNNRDVDPFGKQQFDLQKGSARIGQPQPAPAQ